MDIPTIEPLEITAGDTITWKKTLSDYPAASYTLKYRLINSAGKYDITAAASGDDHLITVTAAVSATYTAGTYTWKSFVEKGSGGTLERYTIGQGTLTVNPDLAAQEAGYDSRSHVKKVLDSIQSVIESRATRADLEKEINGKRISFMSPTELIKWHSHYDRLYMQELNAEKIRQGRRTGRKVLTRFR